MKADVRAARKLPAKDRLAIAQACELLKRNGWAWAREGSDHAVFRFEGGKRKPKFTSTETARLKEIDALVSALNDERSQILLDGYGRGYSVEQRKRLGCLVAMSPHGRLLVRYGVMI